MAQHKVCKILVVIRVGIRMKNRIFGFFIITG